MLLELINDFSRWQVISEFCVCINQQYLEIEIFKLPVTYIQAAHAAQSQKNKGPNKKNGPECREFWLA